VAVWTKLKVGRQNAIGMTNTNSTEHNSIFTLAELFQAAGVVIATGRRIDDNEERAEM